jgi:hypothetical protein
MVGISRNLLLLALACLAVSSPFVGSWLLAKKKTGSSSHALVALLTFLFHFLSFLSGLQDLRSI